MPVKKRFLIFPVEKPITRRSSSRAARNFVESIATISKLAVACKQVLDSPTKKIRRCLVAL